MRLEALAVVLAAVVDRYHRDAGVDDLRELSLGLQWSAQTLNDQNRAGRHLAVFDYAQEHAKRALPNVPLVVGRQSLIPK
ncbi:hypothetical protein ACEPUD_32430 [Burkholderia ubonensis]|uniref:hypothetical protein n=1 Tax=Burkholderia ubonensis TaxID=101571 RepID=UPI0035902DC2